MVLIEYRSDGRVKGDKVWLLDFNNPDNNDWVAVNQFTIIENNINRRPDILIFINGLPLILFELKNAADENEGVFFPCDIDEAHHNYDHHGNHSQWQYR